MRSYFRVYILSHTPHFRMLGESTGDTEGGKMKTEKKGMRGVAKVSELAADQKRLHRYNG